MPMLRGRRLLHWAVLRHHKLRDAFTRRAKNQGSLQRALVFLELLVNHEKNALRTNVMNTVLPRHKLDVKEHVNGPTADHFRRMYRTSKKQFLQLSNVMRPSLQKRQRPNSSASGAVSVEVMLFVTLRLLAGDSYLDVCWLYGLGRSTVYDLFKETLCALDMFLPKITLPATEAECKANADMFCRFRQSPIFGVVAALDGIAIEIKKPRRREVKDPKKYYDRKGFFALCVQAAAQAHYKFCFVSASHSGGTHDSTAFAATRLYGFLKGFKLPNWAMVVADDAYANENRVLTPYPGRGLTRREDSFNAYLSSCRTVVEQAFGVLICRSGTFWSAIRYPLHKVTLIIIVACKLHNLIIETAAITSFETIPSHEDNSVHGSPVVHFQNSLHMEAENMRTRNRKRETSAQRDNIAQQLLDLGYVRRR